MPYAMGLAIVGVAALIVFLLPASPGATFPRYIFLFLLAIILTARFGYGPGLFACLLCNIGVPFLFNQHFTLSAVDVGRLVNAVIISVLFSRMTEISRSRERQAKVIARQNSDLNQALDTLRARTEDLAAAHGALNAVLNAATRTGIVGTDRHGVITLFNTGAEAMLGFDSKGVVGTMNLASFIDAGPDAIEFAGLIRPLDENAFCDRDFTLVRRDGGRLLANIALTAQGDAAGAVLGYAAVIRDITEQRRNEVALYDAMKLAEAAAKSRSEFLATMSHEIRTPLNGVIGMTGLLLDSPLLPEQREFATTIRNSGETLLSIVNDILDFSKIEAGKLNLEEVEFDVYSAVEECAEIVAADAHHKSLEVVLPVRPPSAGMVRGDQGRMRQVLLNLLSNAIKFTHAGEVVTTVSMEPAAGRTVMIRIAVADTGVGIPPDAQERLFLPFSQGDASTTRRYGGTGLGLAISKRLVELMGGEIGVSSEPGKGSTFWFTARLGYADRLETSSAMLAGRRFLVVDDNATNRRVLQLQLERHLCVVHLAESAEEALRLLRDHPPAEAVFDAALIDQCMPGMDGLDLAAAIRSNPAIGGLPILLLTSQNENRQDTRYSAVNDTLLKPVRESQLLRSLHTVLAGRTAPQPVVERSAAPPSVLVAGSGRILVAEDNPVNQRVVALMLRKLGYSPQVAANGLEALQALELCSFRAILMDCQMPEMDGFEATRIIRSRPGESMRTPIIALTANALPGEREKCLAAGMNDYLAKPLTLDLLSRKLREWVLPDDSTDAASSNAGPRSARL